MRALTSTQIDLPPTAPAGAVDAYAYASLHRDFRWHVPAEFNMAEACCARWARDTPHAIAIRAEHEDGRRASHSFADLQHAANRLSRAAPAGIGTRGRCEPGPLSL